MAGKIGGRDESNPKKKKKEGKKEKMSSGPVMTITSRAAFNQLLRRLLRLFQFFVSVFSPAVPPVQARL